MTSIVADSLWGSTPINTFVMLLPASSWGPVGIARWALLLRAGQSPLEPHPGTASGEAQTEREPHQRLRWAAAKRADQPGAYPTLTRQPAPSNKQPRVAHKATHP